MQPLNVGSLSSATTSRSSDLLMLLCVQPSWTAACAISTADVAKLRLGRIDPRRGSTTLNRSSEENDSGVDGALPLPCH